MWLIGMKTMKCTGLYGMVFGWGLTAMIWRGFHSHGGTLIAGWFMENPVKTDDLGVPPICGTSHISTVTMVDEAKHGGFNTNLGDPRSPPWSFQYVSSWLLHG